MKAKALFFYSSFIVPRSSFLLEVFMADYRDKLDEWREAARRAAREASEKLRGVGRTAGERAGEVFGEAKKHYERAARAYSFGSGVTRATSAASVGLFKAFDWARENPKQAVLVSLSIAGGLGAGAG